MDTNCLKKQRITAFLSSIKSEPIKPTFWGKFLYSFEMDVQEAKRDVQPCILPNLRINDRWVDLCKSSFTSQNGPKVGNLLNASAAQKQLKTGLKIYSS